MASPMRSSITSLIGIATVAGLAVWLVVEHRRHADLLQQQQALELQVEEMARLAEGNEQLSSLLARVKRPATPTDEQSRELLRLRGQAGVLRQQTRELETVREENRRAQSALASSRQGTNTARTAATADYWPQES